MIPDFRDDGYLPDGLHLTSEADVTFRFGSSTPRRRRLILRLRRWLELARISRARRFLVDGSFVTDKKEPHDIDWVEFFSRTRELDGRRKGLVEIEL